MAYSYTYDAMGRLSKKSASGRTLLSLEYDGNGNRIRQTDVTGKITEYHFDLLDRLTEVWDDGDKLAEYVYHSDGTIQKSMDRSRRNTPMMQTGTLPDLRFSAWQPSGR